ncbi:hypothetical protein ZEAMMB73_Zm00001d003635 [Zea mays]|uniref:Uncharacterized protein n=1 Tax=Zea mays TaxID=4577 RepID=A0A1D6EAA5_MAIZE|nr:hypothetical protein ZEAMMB73_Zm00001d003635 [Zea mays]
MDVEQWQLIEGASARADKGLETIERCLDNFEEAMLIACTMMMWDLLPIGQRARSSANLLREERGHLQGDMHELNHWAKEAEWTLRVENACLEEANLELSRERKAVEELQKMFSNAQDTGKVVEELKKATEDEMCKPALADDDVVATQVQGENSLLE